MAGGSETMTYGIAQPWVDGKDRAGLEDCAARSDGPARETPGQP
jgi:hypothetical protein